MTLAPYPNGRMSQAALLYQDETRMDFDRAYKLREVVHVRRDEDAILLVRAREHDRVARLEQGAITNVDDIDAFRSQTNRCLR